MSDRAASASLFATLLFTFAYFFGGSGFNQNSTFALTRALVERQELHINAYASNTADVSFHQGRVYANKAPGLSFATALPYALLYAIHGAPKTPLEATVMLYLCTVAICGVSGALIGVLLFRALQSYELALLGVLATPLFAYSTMLFPHVPSALCLLLAYLVIERQPALAGAAMGAATVINYLCAPLTLILLIARLRGRAKRRSALYYIAGGIPFVVFLAWYHAAAFGSPWQTPIATENPAFLDRNAFYGIFYLPQLHALWGITFSPFRGLFYIAPVLLFGVAGMLRERKWTIAAIAATLFLLNASFNGWHGGYTIAPRYVLPAVPLLVLTTMMRPRALFIAAAAISLLFNFAAAAVDPQPPDTLRDPLGKYAIPALLVGGASDDPSVPPWIPALYTGHTSTNRVAIDELTPFTRHAPGSPENEWASFNLGELLFGPGSLASILPWLAVVLTTLAWRRRSLRATHTTPDTRTARSHSA